MKPTPRSIALISLIIAVIAIIGLIGIWLWGRISFDQLQHAGEAVLVYVETLARIHPIFFIIGVIFLPAFGFPVSPLYILGGVLYGFPLAFYISAPALLLNLVLVYVLCNRYFKAWLKQFLQCLGYKLWVIHPEDAWRMTLLIRATPAIPTVIQSYVLALSGVAFRPYIIVSWAIECLQLFVFVFSAGSARKGHWEMVFIGLFLIALIAVIPRLIQRFFSSKK